VSGKRQRQSADAAADDDQLHYQLRSTHQVISHIPMVLWNLPNTRQAAILPARRRTCINPMIDLRLQPSWPSPFEIDLNARERYQGL
jgi:hypothetical protein